MNNRDKKGSDLSEITVRIGSFIYQDNLNPIPRSMVLITGSKYTMKGIYLSSRVHMVLV